MTKYTVCLLLLLLTNVFAGYYAGGNRSGFSSASVNRSYSAPKSTTVVHHNYTYNTHSMHTGFGGFGGFGGGFLSSALGGYVGSSFANANSHNYPVAQVAPMPATQVIPMPATQVIETNTQPLAIVSAVNSPIMTLLVILIAILFACIVYLLVKTSKHNEKW